MSTEAVPLRIVDPLPGYPAPIGAVLWTLEEGRRRTMRVIADLPPEIFYRTETPPGNTIASLLYHIAAIEADWLFSEILERSFPSEVADLFPFDVRDNDGRLTAVAGLGPADLTRRLETVRITLLDSMRGMTIEEYRRVRTFKNYKVTPEWALHHLALHESEHRGQIGEIRRRVGVGRPRI
jgi:uncharacterized damage-inducible protein DinB